MNETNLTAYEAITAEIEAKATAKLMDRRIAALSTEAGANGMLRKRDGKRLETIMNELSTIIDKPVFTGFTYNTNVEAIVAIAATLQFMKGNLRDQVPEVYWSVFDADTRTEIINAYGRMPYLAEELTIEINGENIVVDPTAKERAKAGITPKPAELIVLVNTVAMDLNLLGEYECSQQETDTAWGQALTKITRAELLDKYKHNLVD